MQTTLARESKRMVSMKIREERSNDRTFRNLRAWKEMYHSNTIVLTFCGHTKHKTIGNSKKYKHMRDKWKTLEWFKSFSATSIKIMQTLRKESNKYLAELKSKRKMS